MKLKYLASACSLAMGMALTIPAAVSAAEYDDNAAQGGANAAAEGSNAGAGFGSLDADRDGYLSQEEAHAAGSDVVSNWDEMDQNQDGRIDQSEFSAFEMTSESTEGDHVNKAPGQSNPSSPGDGEPNY